MKKFAFVSAAATREYKDLAEWVQDEFGKDLMRVQYSGDPELSIKQLSSVGAGTTELIINGSPAYRCVYIAKYADTVSFCIRSSKRRMEPIATQWRVRKID